VERHVTVSEEQKEIHVILRSIDWVGDAFWRPPKISLERSPFLIRQSQIVEVSDLRYQVLIRADLGRLDV
jgi:hypothetical protein